MSAKEMKIIRVIVIRGILLVLLSLYFIVVFGQPADVVSFNAARNESSIALQWQLAPGNKLSTVIIERKTVHNEFKAIAEFWVNFDGNTERNFRFTDKKVKEKTTQYRLKLVSQSGDVKYTDELLLDKRVNSSSIPGPLKTEDADPETASAKKAVLATVLPGAKDFKVILRLKLKEKEVENNFF